MSKANVKTEPEPVIVNERLENARFECDCGNVHIRPRNMDRPEPQCISCNNMVWIEDVE